MLSKDRDTPKRTGEQVVHPIAAGETIFAGALVALRAGLLMAGTGETDLTAPARANYYAHNPGGDGDATVEVDRGVFRFDNDVTAPIDRSHIGTQAFIVDDHTVSSSGAARSSAGTVVDVEEDGVWVDTIAWLPVGGGVQ